MIDLRCAVRSGETPTPTTYHHGRESQREVRGDRRLNARVVAFPDPVGHFSRDGRPRPSGRPQRSSPPLSRETIRSPRERSGHRRARHRRPVRRRRDRPGADPLQASGRRVRLSKRNVAGPLARRPRRAVRQPIWMLPPLSGRWPEESPPLRRMPYVSLVPDWPASVTSTRKTNVPEPSIRAGRRCVRSSWVAVGAGCHW